MTLTWTAHKNTGRGVGPKRQWYSAETDLGRVTISPRYPMVTGHWGKGRKRSRSRVVYDVRIGRTLSESGFGTLALAKEFVTEYLAAAGPSERATVVRAWR